MTRKRQVITTVVAVVVLVVAALVAVRLLDDEEPTTGFAYAVTLAPRDAQRVLWTDWAGVRDELDLDLDAGSDGAQVQELLDRGFDADLTATSALGSSAVVIQERLGFSPATLDWELFSQAEDGASLVLKLGGGVTSDDVADRLRTAGYTEPTGPDGFWALGSDQEFSGSATPELAFITFDDDRGLLIAGDTEAGPAAARTTVREASSEPVPAGVVDALGSPLSAALYTGAQVCSALAMANADEREQAAGEELVAQAGEVDPLTGFGMGAERGGGVRVSMGFETDAKARTNADTRAKLATGPAPGQGGDFADRFAVTETRAEGDVVVLDLAPVDGAFVLSDLGTGPLLFATC